MPDTPQVCHVGRKLQRHEEGLARAGDLGQTLLSVQEGREEMPKSLLSFTVVCIGPAFPSL